MSSRLNSCQEWCGHWPTGSITLVDSGFPRMSRSGDVQFTPAVGLMSTSFKPLKVISTVVGYASHTEQGDSSDILI